MNRTSPRRLRCSPLPRPRDRNQRQAGIFVGPEELARQGNHAVDEVGLDQVLADLPLARLVGRHRAVGQDEARGAAGRQVVEEVLHPGEVGVARRRDAVLPPFVVPQPLTAPSRRR